MNNLHSFRFVHLLLFVGYSCNDAVGPFHIFLYPSHHIHVLRMLISISLPSSQRCYCKWCFFPSSVFTGLPIISLRVFFSTFGFFCCHSHRWRFFYFIRLCNLFPIAHFFIPCRYCLLGNKAVGLCRISSLSANFGFFEKYSATSWYKNIGATLFPVRRIAYSACI